MPESFDALLSEIAETAGSAIHPAGPVAARRRGQQRAVRRRVAASVLSVVLLGGAGGLSFGLASHDNGSSAPVIHYGTPTPTAPPSTAPASPSAGTNSPSSSPSVGTSPSSVAGDLHTIVSGAWTPASQFPFSSLKWQANMSQPSINTDDRQWFYSCHGGGTTLSHLGASGYQEISYKATAASETSDAADQVMFFFPSTNAAQQGFAAIQNDYAHCPEPTVGTDGVPITGTVQQTEELDGSYAWLHTFRTANGNAGQPADIASDNHEYFAQRGNVVELVWFGGDSAVDGSTGDLDFLNSLNAGLCAYGGTCPASAHPVTVSIISSTGSTSLALGGGWLEVGVTVTNNSHDTLRKIAPIVSLGHCSCVNTPVPTMPKGELQFSNLFGGSWADVPYNTEGSGMDYVLSTGVLQAPAFDLPAGESVSFNYRVRLDPASQQPKLSPPFHLTNGTSSIDVTLVHPGTGVASPNVQIGKSPAATLPVTVTVN